MTDSLDTSEGEAMPWVKPAESESRNEDAQTMTKEERALGAFLAAMHDSKLDGGKMRAAMLKVLGLSADGQAGGEAIYQWRNRANNYWYDDKKEVAYQRVDEYYEARTLYTHPQPQAVAQGWKPIDTAPRDGSLIIVRGNNYNDAGKGQHHSLACWHNGCWMEASDGNPTSELTYLTDWAPMPSELGSASPLAPAAAQVAQPLTCEWSLTDDDAGVYSSACGEMWVFNDGGPKENSVRFCHGCGKPVSIAHGIGKDQARVGINGLTEAETAASASVMGLTSKNKEQ